ncbi:MAG: exo-alpha-sialidase [Bryobacteraceae bacterium]|nr:exo-alpha-sialidase [Bryobacteraceae bacterium]MDW8376536.1 exo-alpha-sialidase [Bryobacterales bacterium]
MSRSRFLVLAVIPSLVAANPDWRDIRQGREIPTETYADQPYVVKTDDGAWLVCLTTGSGREGEPGQHVVTMRSRDQGRTWEKPVDVEPASGPEASYAVMLKTPSGRIYIFYNHNTDNVRQVLGDDPPYKDRIVRRVDSLGHFVFKYSDDHGRSWSPRRYEIPQRDFEIDERNVYQGKLKFFWNVGRPFTFRGVAYVPIHKVGGLGEGFFTSSEGALLRSENLLTEQDPEKIRWETLPEGKVGLRTPAGTGGPVAEEQSFSVLSDGSFFVVYRTIDGHPVYSYSRNQGRSWDPPQYMRYADGRLIKHPRAANFAWRCENGKYLYWFHNHGGRFIRDHPRRRTLAYEDRNPVWLAAGEEVDSPQGKVIRWSQPEIVLYDDDPVIRISYPDLIEDQGKYFLTETQKDVARVHEIDSQLIEGLFRQFENRELTTQGLLLALPVRGPMPKAAPLPALPLFVRRSTTRHDYGTEDLRSGVSIEVRLQLLRLDPGQILLDNRTPDGRGFVLQTAASAAVELQLHDGRTSARLLSDPGVLRVGTPHHVVAIVDGGPKVMSFVLDGKLQDGGEARQFGWQRFNPNLLSINGSPELRIGPGVRTVRIYGRALRTSEAIGNWRSGQ